MACPTQDFLPPRRILVIRIVGEAVMVEVVGRSVETILEEWRAGERELEGVSGNQRAVVEARVAALREEHRVAVAEREPLAEELRRLSS